MEIMSASKFYEVSGKDFRVDKNAADPKEKELYTEFAKADLDNNGVTYDEYLDYLSKSSAGQNLKITKIDIENAGILSNVEDPTFHKNGKLKSATVSIDQNIQGFPCKAGTEIFFYEENGALGKATLSIDKEIQGIKFKKGTILFNISKNGTLNYVSIQSDTVIQGLKFKAKTGISFQENGKIESAHLSVDTVIHGVKYKSSSRVHFNDKGKVSSVDENYIDYM